MGTLQEAFNRTIEELPQTLFRDMLDKKLQEQGIRLSKRKLAELSAAILTDRTGSLQFDDGKTRKRKRDVKLDFSKSDADLLEQKINRLAKKLPSLIEQLTDYASQKILLSSHKRWPQEAKSQRRDINQFLDNLDARWGDAIQKLKMLTTIAREFGSNINEDLRRSDGGERPKTFEVLIKLHARSCQISEEVICLISSGFADGAMARWRTLHEIAAVSLLIERFGDDLAERYEAHQIIESRKAALQFQKYRRRLRQRPITAKQMQKIESERQQLLEKYGSDFASSQGWAAKHLGKRDPTIADIQEAAGIEHLSPYYRLASHNIHANPKGVFFKLGLMGESETLLAGPSNAGLADPGHATALSLVQISSSLLHLCQTIDYQVTLKVMHLLSDEIGISLITAHKKLEADEQQSSRARKRRNLAPNTIKKEAPQHLVE